MKKIAFVFAGALILSGCGASENVSEEIGGKAEEKQVVEAGSNVTSDYLGSYEINDDEHGTSVKVVVDGETRMITSNALPNHAVGTFPNEGNPNTISAQERTWTLTTSPTFTGAARFSREAGVAINGVKFEPQTAERLTCTSGEVYSIEALQGFLDFGVDENNAHVQPTGEYHYHGISQNLVATAATDDPVHIGFANDGFLIYYSPSNQYTPSFALKTEERTGTGCAYENPTTVIEQEMEGTAPDGSFVSDWEFVEGAGDLDACNGIEINGEYAYVLTDDYPYIPRCLNGEFGQQGGGGGQGGQAQGDGQRPPRGEGGERPPRGGGSPGGTPPAQEIQ